MLQAQKFATSAGLSVELWVSHYPEDAGVAPEAFQRAPDLTRSVLDCGEFSKPRKLPLIADILQRLDDVSQAEYFVYTNVDIGLQPVFYAAVARMIEQGHDALIINRRTIPTLYSAIEDLPLIYSELGIDHPGFDCFVFRKSALPSYLLGTICVGAIFIGKAMVMNMMINANRPAVMERSHLTFHIGNDGTWRKGDSNEYADHNRTQLWQAVRQLASQGARLDPKQTQRLFAQMRPWPSGIRPALQKISGGHWPGNPP